MGLWSNQTIAHDLHGEIAARVEQSHESNTNAHRRSPEPHAASTNLMTVPWLDFQVIGVEGCLVPSPRIFLAGGPPASLLLRFLFLPRLCRA